MYKKGDSETYGELKPYLDRLMALHTAQVLFGWDQQTQAPKEANPRTSAVIGILSGEYYRTVTDERLKTLKEACEKDAGLTDTEAAIVRELGDTMEKLSCIPEKEYRQFAELTARAAAVWEKAKKEKNFEAFAPTLKEILNIQKHFASCRAKNGEKLYDVMLGGYEKNFDMECLDRFFGRLREVIVPFVKKLTESGVRIDDSFLTGDFSEEKQAQIARFVAGYVGFDFQRGVLGVSAHPFTMSLHNRDVRMTTAYNNHVDDAIFSVIHEAGHAMYELHIPDELTQTLVGTGTSMGMHESQSRFLENVIGRSRAFWVPVYPKLAEVFPEQLSGVSLDDFVRAVSKVQPGPIRTQADELTYPIHILIRYELEKMLVEEDLPVWDIPEVWAGKYEEYLGVRPEDASEGALQDIHWSQGSFGYFPSYALGSAFAAQFYSHMRRTMDIDALLEKGDLSPIWEYLRENVHRYGKMKTSRQILKDATGEDFNPQYYIDYLLEKYGGLYQVSA